MPRPPRLEESQIEEGLSKLQGWELTDGKLHRVLTFKDFVTAFGWMTSAALVAEKLDHHPDWSNVWNRVEVTLWTHDVGGLTELDLKLARKMSLLAKRYGGE